MTPAVLTAQTEARGEYTTLTLISSAHLVSHIYMLVFVPILADLKTLLGVSYSELALAFTVMNVVSALTQAPTGFLVDRVGARSLLVAGLTLGGMAYMAVGIWPSYPMLLAAAAAIGLANAVYHPADYSILSAEMSARRMGRAYAIHSFTGYLGFAIAPPVVYAAAHFLGGPRGALILCGLIGPLMTLPLLPGCRGERSGAKTPASKGAAPVHSALSLLTPTVLLLTLMYTTLNLSTGILQTYMIVALEDLHHLTKEEAGLALTLFLIAIVAGVLAGGFLADRAQRQSLITSGALAVAAVLAGLVGAFAPGAVMALVLMTLIGFAAGIIVPSRDLLTRNASPPGAAGRVFGIVTTGFNFGGMTGPILGAWFIDQHAPQWIFYVSAVFMAATIILAIMADTNGRAIAAAGEPV